MPEINTEIFLKQAIANSEPQPHRSKWITQEDNILHECILRGLSLVDIAKVIRFRSLGAICTRANHLGYGNKRNKDDIQTYFIKEINHKNRRTKDEIILAKKEEIPIKPTDLTGINIEVDVDIIPKVEITVADLDKMIKILTTAKEQL